MRGSRLRLFGRLLGGLAVLVGGALAVVGLTAPGTVVLGSQPFALGPLTDFHLLGLGGALVALGGLVAVAGRGRTLGVSAGGLAVVTALAVVVTAPPSTVPYFLPVGLLGLVVVAAASLATS